MLRGLSRCARRRMQRLPRVWPNASLKVIFLKRVGGLVSGARGLVIR